MFLGAIRSFFLVCDRFGMSGRGASGSERESLTEALLHLEQIPAERKTVDRSGVEATILCHFAEHRLHDALEADEVAFPDRVAGQERTDEGLDQLLDPIGWGGDDAVEIEVVGEGDTALGIELSANVVVYALPIAVFEWERISEIQQLFVEEHTGRVEAEVTPRLLAVEHILGNVLPLHILLEGAVGGLATDVGSEEMCLQGE